MKGLEHTDSGGAHIHGEMGGRISDADGQEEVSEGVEEDSGYHQGKGRLEMSDVRKAMQKAG